MITATAVYVFVCICSLALIRSGYARFRNNFSKTFLNLIVGGWTLFYAGIGPLLSEFLDVADPYLANYYMLGSVLLLASQAVFFWLLSVMRFANPAWHFKMPERSYWLLFFIVLAIGVCMLVPGVSHYTPLLLGVTQLPGATTLYLAAGTRGKLLIGAIAMHAFVFYLAVESGVVVESKEMFVIAIMGPPGFAYLARMRKLQLHRGLIALAVAGVLFLIAMPIVNSTRRGLDYDVTTLVEQYKIRSSDIAKNALGRILVLDALARTLDNEFAPIPLRPADPYWTIVGPFFALVPAFFVRPDHAREALAMTGYVTSSPDVNIAVTYVGHLIWSFGIGWLALTGLIFWVWALKMCQAAVLLRSELAMLYLFSAAYSFFRLETLANVVLGRLLFALVALWVLQLGLSLFQRPRNTIRPRPLPVESRWRNRVS